MINSNALIDLIDYSTFPTFFIRFSSMSKREAISIFPVTKSLQDGLAMPSSPASPLLSPHPCPIFNDAPLKICRFLSKSVFPAGPMPPWLPRYTDAVASTAPAPAAFLLTYPLRWRQNHSPASQILWLHVPWFSTESFLRPTEVLLLSQPCLWILTPSPDKTHPWEARPGLLTSCFRAPTHSFLLPEGLQSQLRQHRQREVVTNPCALLVPTEEGPHLPLC